MKDNLEELLYSQASDALRQAEAEPTDSAIESSVRHHLDSQVQYGSGLADQSGLAARWSRRVGPRLRALGTRRGALKLVRRDRLGYQRGCHRASGGGH